MAVNDGKAQHTGRALREIRRRLALSQEALEQLSGVSQTTLSRYEAGQDMYLSNAVQLADALGISLDELTGRKAPAPSALPVHDEPTPEDPYPNRGRLRALPEYAAAPAAVRERIEGVPQGWDDLTLFEWIDELRLFSMLHARGQLEVVLGPRVASPGRGRARGSERRTSPKPSRGE